MKTFLKIDHWVQFITLIIMAATLPIFFIPMLLLMFLGGWQLLSGLITAIFYKKLDRKKYLAKALGYLLFLVIGAALNDAGWLPKFINTFGGFVVFALLIPFAIGFWYYRMVTKDYHKYCIKPTTKSNTMEMNSPFEGEEMILNNNRLFPIGYSNFHSSSFAINWWRR